MLCNFIGHKWRSTKLTALVNIVEVKYECTCCQKIYTNYEYRDMYHGMAYHYDLYGKECDCYYERYN